MSSDVAVFLTHTHPTSTPPWQLPPTVSPFFRTFSLPLPDPTIAFRAHCMALGLRASKILANKLTNLQTMARDQLYVSTCTVYVLYSIHIHVQLMVPLTLLVMVYIHVDA